MSANVSAREFCSDPLFNSSFFNTSSLLLTNCLQYSLLNTPCPFILIFLIFIGRFTAHTDVFTRKPRYWKYMFEFFITSLLIICHVTNLLVFLIHDESSNVDIICYLTESLLCFALIVNCFMNYYNRSSYFIRNSWDYFFWLLYIFSFLPRFYYLVTTKSAAMYPVNMPMAILLPAFVRLICSIFLLVLKSISNKNYPKKLIFTSIGSSGRRYNPEPYAGILSMWSFNWLNPIMIRALRGRICKLEDVFYVRPHESVNKNYKRLLSFWIKLKPENTSHHAENSQSTDPIDVEDTVQLIEPDHNHSDRAISASVRKASFALVRALFAAFGSDLYISWTFMFFQALMAYASPVLLSSMLAYLALEPTERFAWHGYLICFGFLVTPLMVIFTYNRGFFFTYHVGNRIRVSMSSLIYRKALVLSATARTEYSAGELTNLVTVDVDHIVNCASQLHALFVVIFQLGIATFMLYQQLGVSAFTGLAVVFASIPVNTFAGWISQTFEFKELAQKDRRMKILSEVFNGIRILKLYAWEPAFEKMAQKIRLKELKMLAASLGGFGLMNVSWCVFPFLVLISTLYTFLSRMVSSNHESVNVLTPEKIFVSLTLFGLIKFPLLLLPWTLNVVLMAYASLKRLSKFLIASELDPNVVQSLPRYEEEQSDYAVEFNDVSLKWRPESKNNALNKLCFRVKHGSLVAIVGPVGSGKSSIISAIMGEMYKTEGEVKVRGSLAYVSQTPWIQQHSILGNVLFGSRWDSDWYFKVTEACALRVDVERMDQGDETIIGERGVNLSGGQKQRVNLARAVYQKRDIYLLDDPLSAVDAHVAKHLFEQVLSHSGLLKDVTRLVVTHSIHYLSMFDYILVMNTDGCLVQQGSYQELLDSDQDFFRNYIKTMDTNNDQASEPERRLSLQSRVSNELTESGRFVPRPQTQDSEMLPHGYVHSNAQATTVATNHLINIAGFDRPPSLSSSPLTSGFGIKQISELRGLPGTSPMDDRGMFGSLASDTQVRRRRDSMLKTIQSEMDKKNKPLSRGSSMTRTEQKVDVGRQCSVSSRIRVPSVRFNIPVCEANHSVLHDCDPNNNYSDDEWGDQIDTPSLEVIGESLPEESIELEGVSWRSYVAYLVARSQVLILLTLIFFCGFQFLDVFCTYWLRWFADDARIFNATRKLNDPSTTPEERVQLVKLIYDISHYYLQSYGLIGLAMAFFCLVYIAFSTVSTVLASSRIHRRLLHRVLRAPASFFDKVPIGRILNRFSSDIDTVDHGLPSSLHETITTLLNTVVAVVVVVYSLKPFYFGLLMVVPIVIVCIVLQKMYLPCSRQARRLWSISKSPTLACFNESAMSRVGASTLRVFGKTPLFVRSMNRLLNDTASAWFLNYSLHRWLDIRLEAVGSIFVFITSACIVYHRQDYTPGMAGLMIVFALQCSECFSWLTKNAATVENSAVCLERVDEYSRMNQEADWTIEKERPPTSWPRNFSQVCFQDVSISYDGSEKPALDKLCVKMGGSPKERVVGIVGRTGAGKSTLAASLFRMVEVNSGCILIDGVDIGKIGLHDLRRRLRILPQEAVIFSGSLRTNLDPFEQFSDEQIWSAIKDAHLEEWAQSQDEGLQFECGEGGANMSVGQRQLLCLARVLLSAHNDEGNLNLLVLDEATSAMDPMTDKLVMQTVLSPTGKFCKSTILIIAHRLSTIMSADLVLVMENGRVIEQGNPIQLLKDPQSTFSKMNADQVNSNNDLPSPKD